MSSRRITFVSSANAEHTTSLFEAVLEGVPADGGLWMPSHLPTLIGGQDDEHPLSFSRLPSLSMGEIGAAILAPFLEEELSAEETREIAMDALNFDAPLVHAEPESQPNRLVLELFRGPTEAFKDFGARVMSRVFAALLKKRGELGKRRVEYVVAL